MKRCDVLVVGGGPAGVAAARAAAAVGARVVLCDRGHDGGEAVRCAGLVSPRTQELLGFSDRVVLRRIRRIRIHAPGGRVVEIASETVKGLVLDRAGLQEELLSLAARDGIEVLRPCRAVRREEDRLVLEGRGGGEVSSQVVVGADGARGSVATWYGLQGAGELLRGGQALVLGEPHQADGVEVFLGSQVAPGFFAWCVPAEEGRLRVGLAVVEGADPQPFLVRLLAERFPGPVVARGGGLIPIGAPAQTAGDGVLVAGDAAGQTKPTSGGGIYTGALCASIGGEIAGYASLTGRTSRETLQEYDDRWRSAVGDELRFGLGLHHLRGTLSDPEIDLLCATIDEASVLDVAARVGDLDRQTELVRALVQRRDLWPRFVPLLPLVSSHPLDEGLALLFVPRQGGSL